MGRDRIIGGKGRRANPLYIFRVVTMVSSQLSFWKERDFGCWTDA